MLRSARRLPARPDPDEAAEPGRPRVQAVAAARADPQPRPAALHLADGGAARPLPRPPPQLLQGLPRGRHLLLVRPQWRLHLFSLVLILISNTSRVYERVREKLGVEMS